MVACRHLNDCFAAVPCGIVLCPGQRLFVEFGGWIGSSLSAAIKANPVLDFRYRTDGGCLLQQNSRTRIRPRGPVLAESLALQAGAEPFPGYRLLHILGQGGYAEVWAAEHEGSRVALKFMHNRDPVVAAKEVRAIQSMKEIRHPYLVRIDQVWSLPGHVVFSMELAEGSLMDLLYAYYAEFHGPMEPGPLCRYMAQAAEAIDFLNARHHVVDGNRLGFQHGDIKPSNILVFGDTVKLADFGLAVPMSVPRVNRAPCGTVHFAAPEVFQGCLTDRSDQYSLAVSYCLLRGGRLPFTDSPPSFREAYVRPAPDLTMLPDAERPAIARALSLVPQDRWVNCLALVDNLARIHSVDLMDLATAR
jgi:serine/threonine-protein kinase